MFYIQLCAGLKHMHNFDPPYAHNDVKPVNVLLTQRKGQAPLAKLMDFANARPARRQIRSRSEALELQVLMLLLLYRCIFCRIMSASFSSFPTFEPEQGECHHCCINNLWMLLSFFALLLTVHTLPHSYAFLFGLICFVIIIQEWASEHVSASFRAPELWDCPSQYDIDERTDVWSLGCTLFAIM